MRRTLYKNILNATVLPMNDQPPTESVAIVLVPGGSPGASPTARASEDATPFFVRLPRDAATRARAVDAIAAAVGAAGAAALARWHAVPIVDLTAPQYRDGGANNRARARDAAAAWAAATGCEIIALTEAP